MDYPPPRKIPHIDDQIPTLSSPRSRTPSVQSPRPQSPRPSSYQAPRPQSPRPSSYQVPRSQSYQAPRGSVQRGSSYQSPRGSVPRPQSPRIVSRYSEQEAFNELERARQNKRPLNITFVDNDGNSGHIRYNIVSDMHRNEEELDIKGANYEEYRKIINYSSRPRK